MCCSGCSSGSGTRRRTRTDRTLRQYAELAVLQSFLGFRGLHGSWGEGAPRVEVQSPVPFALMAGSDDQLEGNMLKGLRPPCGRVHWPRPVPLGCNGVLRLLNLTMLSDGLLL